MVTNIWDEKIDKCLAGGLIVLLVSGIILNILANYYQYKILKRRRFSATVVFFAVLTVVDQLTLLFSVPVMIGTLLSRRQWRSQDTVWGRILCNVTGFVHNFTSRAALYVVLLMAVGRLYALGRPFQYRRMYNKNKTILMAAGAWIVSILLSVLPYFKGTQYFYQWTECICTYKIDNIFNIQQPGLLQNWVVPYLLLIILPTTLPGFLIIVLLVLTLVGMYLLHRRKMQSRQFACNPELAPGTTHTNNSDENAGVKRKRQIMTKATKTLLVMISTFCLTYLWWWSFSIWQMFILSGVTTTSLLTVTEDKRTYLYLLQMTVINVYLSCITDPLVYLLLGCRRSDLRTSDPVAMHLTKEALNHRGVRFKTNSTSTGYLERDNTKL